MWRQTLTLLTVLATAGAFRFDQGQHFFHNIFIDYTDNNHVDDNWCRPEYMTMEERLDDIVADIDRVQPEGVVDSADVSKDFALYDRDGDGRVTEGECVDGWLCAHKDTAHVATFLCNWFNQGREAMTLAQALVPPYDTGVTVNAYRAAAENRYREFVERGCVNQSLTLDEQLMLAVHARDLNPPDGVVTTFDIEFDLRWNYDTNNDGTVTQSEFILHTICMYGVSGHYARFLFHNITCASSFSIDRYLNRLGDWSLPVLDFYRNTKENYEAFERQQKEKKFQKKLDLFMDRFWWWSPRSQRGGCAPTTLTLDEKLELIGKDNDNDGDGVVTLCDLQRDIQENYDTNGDGLVTEEEWTARWQCDYGDSTYLSNFVFNSFSNGLASVSVDYFNAPPFDVGVSVDEFRGMIRRIYDRFYAEQCVDRDLTLDEKLDLVVSYNNFNNDTVIDTADIIAELNIMDTDRDGVVTLVEWVLRAACAYGDSGQYTRWALAGKDGQGFEPTVIATFAAQNPRFDTGVSVQSFRAEARDTREEYAQQLPASGGN